jgi:two-component system chemotaxis sensor kinase CheA
MVQRRGLRSADTETLGSQELFHLLLKGGISTSSTVTEISGRGVGLDVVREAVERLGGDVAVRTSVAKGTTIELKVPLSLASFQALVVEASGVQASVPFDAVRRTVRVLPDEVMRTPHGQSILYDGGSIPLASLAGAIAPRVAPVGTTGPFSAVVVQGRTSAAAFRVDRVVEVANVVLRPLPDLAVGAAFVAGTSFDLDGTPRLVLEPDALVAAAAGQTLVAGDHAEIARRSILVIDDSLTTRMLEQSILESAGYEVDVASSGEEGLEKARGHRYALFLVDVEMPGIDGFTFVERARDDAGLRDVPSILVTSRSTPEDQQRGRDVGALAYIVKSEFDQSVLLERIRRIVG